MRIVSICRRARELNGTEPFLTRSFGGSEPESACPTVARFWLTWVVDTRLQASGAAIVREVLTVDLLRYIVNRRHGEVLPPSDY